jgi:hypothetical protein
MAPAQGDIQILDNSTCIWRQHNATHQTLFEKGERKVMGNGNKIVQN